MWAATVTASLAVAFTAAAPTAAAQAITTTKTHIQYFVSPHPDDVFEAWSLVQDSSANYPVFITLTMGEKTGYCSTRTLDLGSPWGTVSITEGDLPSCKAARMASLNAWLDDQSAADAYLNDFVRAENTSAGYNMTKYTDVAPAGGTDSGGPNAAGMTGCNPAWGSTGCTGTNPTAGVPVPSNLNEVPALQQSAAQQVTWYVGSTSARVEFDLGDGNLTDAEVVWAVDYVRANRATRLPLTNEYGVVAAAYSNLAGHYTACYDYSHHDHRAVHEAIYNNDLIDAAGSHPQWGATCGSQTTTVGVDPEVAAGGRSKQITNTHYNENMSTSSSYFQKRFGWLHNGTLWPSGKDPVAGTNGVLFSQWNYFWARNF
ncbi:hypothetical protein [Catellatospora tritici]|uniref:hypothetical protein n=1 Tax=Catellatospora tritici TaxID=2851566 RepID=UPI001C2CDFBC|nr:hypothetical protein [Catellatospora tritici]MBV1848801.1 hypothetical protein [Catellatospora tritici]